MAVFISCNDRGSEDRQNLTLVEASVCLWKAVRLSVGAMDGELLDALNTLQVTETTKRDSGCSWNG